MALSVICPQCSKPYFLPDSSLGKRLGCKKCGAQFVLDSVFGEPPPPPRPDASAGDGAVVSVVIGRRIPEISDEQAARIMASQEAKDAAPAAGKAAAPVPPPPPPPPTASAGPSSVVQPPSEPQSSSGLLIGIGIVACLLVIILLVIGKGSPKDRTASSQGSPALTGPEAGQKQATSTAPVSSQESTRKGGDTAPASDDPAVQALLKKYHAAVTRMNRHAEAGEWKDALAALDEASRLGLLMTHPPEGFEALAMKRKVMGSMASKTPGPDVETPKTETTAVVTPELKDQTEVTLPAFEGLRVTAQPGVVVLNCVPPEKIPCFAPVRVEVQRGTSPDRFDTLVHVFEMSAVLAAAKSGDAAKKPNLSAGEKAGTTARSAKRQLPSTKSAQKDSPMGVGGPNRFDDLNVDAQATYYYRARLIARGLDQVILRDGKETRAVVTDSIERVHSAEEKGVLYASPWSRVERATVPGHFQLRFNFVTGEVPDASEPQVGYSAHMGVRLWDTEVGGWGEASFEATVGQPIKGKVTLRTGSANKIREFDTGWALVRVRTATRFEVERVREPVLVTRTAANGETITVPALDEAKKPKWVERLVPRRQPIQIAVLQEARTGEQTRLIKGMGYEEKLPPSARILLEGEPEPLIE